MDTPETIILEIRSYIEKCGMTQGDVAAILGMTVQNTSIFLSTTTPHKITAKSATRLCSKFPFNYDYLTTGKGSLLTADTYGSDFPDRRNWREIDYEVACSRVQRELDFCEVKRDLGDMMSVLFVSKNEYEIENCYRACRNIVSTNTETEFDWHSCGWIERKNWSIERWQKELDELIIKRRSFFLSEKKNIAILRQWMPNIMKTFMGSIIE